MTGDYGNWGSEWPPDVYYRTIRQRGQGGGGSAILDPATLNPFIWYDSSDLTTLFQDHLGTVPVTADGDPVGDFLNKTVPPNGAIQSDVNLKPTFKEVGGARWIQGDGADYLDDTAISHVQPFSVFTAARLLAYPAPFGFVWGSGANQEYGLAFTSAVMNMSANNFTNFIEIAAPALDTDIIITQIFNGASSFLGILGGASVSGNAGAGNLSFMNLFARAGLSPASLRLYGMIGVDGVADAALQLRITDYLATKLP